LGALAQFADVERSGEDFRADGFRFLAARTVLFSGDFLASDDGALGFPGSVNSRPKLFNG
jgi:hypothetical protein